METKAAATKDAIPDFTRVEHLPRLEIVSTRSSYRNCYTEVEYRVRSSSKLSAADFLWLLEKGFFMSGQMFSTRGPHDGSEQVKGRWTVDGKSWVSFYEYSVECAVDSSD